MAGSGDGHWPIAPKSWENNFVATCVTIDLLSLEHFKSIASNLKTSHLTDTHDHGRPLKTSQVTHQSSKMKATSFLLAPLLLTSALA